jgi:hypothetical protein
MQPLLRRSVHFVPAVLAALLTTTAPSLAQTCGPAACGAGFHYVHFETLAPGTPVEGLGAVDPDLAIASVTWPFGLSCTPGTAMVIEEGNTFPFVAYSTLSAVDNGCLNGIHGFADSAGCVLDYDFTFAPGISVTCFSIRMFDFGDFFPFGGTNHIVQLTAYDAANVVVDQDQLTQVGPVDNILGDACSAQLGQPGNFQFQVFGPGIVKVTLRFNAFPDPNIGFDDITFCENLATPAAPRTWGRIRTLYR